MSKPEISGRVRYVGGDIKYMGLSGTIIDSNPYHYCVRWDGFGRRESWHRLSDLRVARAEASAAATAAQVDPVNQPQHYTSGEIECIDAIRASMSKEAFCGFLKGNMQKYMWRYEKKVNPVEDIKKARWYAERLIKELENA